MKKILAFSIMFLAAPLLSAQAITPTSTWHLQLDGKLKHPNRQVYDIDLVETSTAAIAALHKKGRTVICYFSAGSFEDWRPDADQFPPAAKGKQIDNWPGEKWLDIRMPEIMDIMRSRLDLAVDKGCDGVDPDNVDAYSNDSGFPLTSEDQVNYNKAIAAEAHTRGLVVGLKNALDIIPQLADDFDFAVNEECLQYEECDKYGPFALQSKAVFAVDYGKYKRAKCTTTKALGLNLQFYKLSLKSVGRQCPKR
jgi:hypothetical protein